MITHPSVIVGVVGHCGGSAGTKPALEQVWGRRGQSCADRPVDRRLLVRGLRSWLGGSYARSVGRWVACRYARKVSSPANQPPGRGTTTASMAAYDADAIKGGSAAGSAGLVLLYAAGYRELAAAYPLIKNDVFIGREPPADLLLAQPAVSRSHARLYFDGVGWTLYDMGATNGVVVNGAFIRQHRLNHLDEVRIGDAFFKFVSAGAELYVPYRIDGAVLSQAGGRPYATPSGVVGGHQLALIASSLERIAMRDISVILLGESGSGKEVFARQVHRWSGRKGAFCAVNCAAIPPALLESELFGYRRGAFSGADRDHVGLVRAADHGTLFLDEVGDMPLEAQAKLLRMLQTREVLPLGATRPESVDVRIVCATHRDLAVMQQEGRFRPDLFARLNEYNVLLPALRHRKEDVFALCLEFLRLQKRPDMELTVPFMTGLLHYNFPYNVRELQALIKRGIALTDGSKLTADHLSNEIQHVTRNYGQRENPTHEPCSPAPTRTPATAYPAAVSYQQAMSASLTLAPATNPTSWAAQAPATSPRNEAPGAAELRAVLQEECGNVAAVGRRYGKERMQVHRWMKKLGIDPNQYR